MIDSFFIQDFCLSLFQMQAKLKIYFNLLALSGTLFTLFVNYLVFNPSTQVLKTYCHNTQYMDTVLLLLNITELSTANSAELPSTNITWLPTERPTLSLNETLRIIKLTQNPDIGTRSKVSILKIYTYTMINKG